MSKLILRTAFLALLLASVAALPVLAQIPPGIDPWVTPGNGQTYNVIADGDLEALCNKAPDPDWNHTVILKGNPPAGVDYDTTVKRLDKATFDTTGTATTRVQVSSLSFVSANPSMATPCGDIDWVVKLSGPQPVTKMTIKQTSARGGVFSADLVVIVEMQAFYAGTSRYLGSLYYAITLPQGSTGTPWSWGPDRLYRPGINDTDDCIAALRVKLTQYATTSSHYYFISDMIAQGRCRKQ